MLWAPLSFPINLVLFSGNLEPVPETAKRLLMSLLKSAGATTPISRSTFLGATHRPMKHLIKLSMLYWTFFILFGLMTPPLSSMFFQQTSETTRKPDPYNLVSGETNILTKPLLKSMLIKYDFGSVIGPFSVFSLVTTGLERTSSVPNCRRLWNPGIALLLWT